MSAYRMKLSIDSEPTKRAWKTSGLICELYGFLCINADNKLADYIWCAFPWASCADEYPDITAEEIASMAADGFEVQ